MADYTADEVIERWNLHARDYAASCTTYGSPNKEVLLTPVVLEMLGGIEGKKILDAGCGEGFLSRLMAEGGASVVAVDYSEKLLEIARERTPDHLRIDYRHGNIERLALSDCAFDIVVACGVIHDLPDYRSAMEEMHRVLVPGGVLILAMLHPCFGSNGGWVRDSDGNRLHWKIDNYFHERAYELAGLFGESENPIYFHRTLTTYFRTITDMGFTIEELVEPRPSQAAIQKHPRFRDDLRMSHFLALKLRK